MRSFAKKKSLHESYRMGRRTDTDSLICSLGHCECDGHTVCKLSQRRLTADWLVPRESDCLLLRSKVSSDWLPSYIKTTRTVLKISKMARYSLNRPRTFIHSSHSVLQVHTLFQSQFSTDCDLLLPLSSSIILSFSCHTVADVFSLFFLSLLSFPFIISSIMRFRRQFPRKLWPNQSASLLCTVCSMFLSSLTVRNTSHSTGPADLHLSPAPHLLRSISIQFRFQILKYP